MCRKNFQHFAGCLLGGAIGDALGYPVEFLSLDQIRTQCGRSGVTDFPDRPAKALISDDTQMTLFTAEGILRAQCRQLKKGVCNPFAVIKHAYLRWLHTQGGSEDRQFDGWLVNIPQLNHQRAPGNTCITSLLSDELGAPDRPINDSKGCGGVMRVAPVGLVVLQEQAFEFACKTAAITHGHPTGYLAAGVFAQIISEIVNGAQLDEAIQTALTELRRRPQHEECLRALEQAIDLARRTEASAEIVEQLGAGWIAEEALAIAVYCSLKYENDFAKGVLLAVNHSGDSDSTGSITGNILGCLLGKDAIPQHWREKVELSREIEMLAADLLTEFRDDDEWWARYPGW